MSHILKDVIKNISIDCVIFGFENSSLEVLLVKRAINPEKGKWALPGGFIKKNELVKEAAQRILEETTGIKNIYLEEITIFDAIDRYPLRRVFTIGHFALVKPEHYKLSSGVDTSEVKWFKLSEIPKLPFDHNEIVKVALEKLRTRIRYRPIGFELLPEKFTLPQLQTLYEVILGKKLDKRNFRKKLMNMNLLIRFKKTSTNGKRRPAFLYKFDKRNYERLKEKGFIFEL
ncbi:MAG: NUDIX domain-containing protein [Melioribacter sp.]|uniref:NUDIX hydrolase n=1 Tax=Rosettibacter primus TaxID=3111523 RepID=UPI00247B3331|nr:NUDIX domain-containing protein [Melioribacter sp.]